MPPIRIFPCAPAEYTDEKFCQPTGFDMFFPRSVLILLRSQKMIMRNNILVRAVLHAKPARDHTKRNKAQFLIKPECRKVGFYHRVKLQNTKAQLLCLFHAVAHQFFADALPAQTAFDRIACIADMPAPSDIVRMQNIQAGDFSSFRVIRQTCVGLC